MVNPSNDNVGHTASKMSAARRPLSPKDPLSRNGAQLLRVRAPMAFVAIRRGTSIQWNNSRREDRVGE